MLIACRARGKNRREVCLIRILVVEDADQTASLVRDLGHAPLLVLMGALALHKAETWGPDLVLVDLTRADGLALARHLRANSNYVPIIGITGFIDVDQRKTAIDAGVDEFLPKPFRPNELAAMLKRFETRIAGSEPIAARPPEVA